MENIIFHEIDGLANIEKCKKCGKEIRGSKNIIIELINHQAWYFDKIHSVDSKFVPCWEMNCTL